MPRTYSLQETTMSCRPRSSSFVVATASTRDCSRLRYLWGRSLKSAGFADCCTTLNELLSICQEFPNLGGLVFGCIEAVISECPTSVRDKKFAKRRTQRYQSNRHSCSWKLLTLQEHLWISPVSWASQPLSASQPRRHSYRARTGRTTWTQNLLQSMQVVHRWNTIKLNCSILLCHPVAVQSHRNASVLLRS